MKNKKIITTGLSYVFLILIFAFALFPLVYMVLSAFKTNAEIMTDPAKILPSGLNLDNFKSVWLSPDFNVKRQFLNSVIYTAVCVAVNMFIAVTMGYVFATGHFPLKKTLFACFSALMFVRTGGIEIYPTFQLLNDIHLPLNLYTLLFTKLFGIPVVHMYLVRGYIRSIPSAVGEAAKIDGCGYSQILFRVYMPLIKPIMATIILLSFQSSWNDYLMVSYYTLTRPEQRTLMVGLMALVNNEGAATSYNLILAGATVAMIPILVVYSFCSKMFVQGLSAGAVKG